MSYVTTNRHTRLFQDAVRHKSLRNCKTLFKWVAILALFEKKKTTLKILLPFPISHSLHLFSNSRVHFYLINLSAA